VTKILLTGATSFIGKRFLEDVLALTDWAVYSLERRYQPNQDRVQRFYHDLRAEVPVQIVNQIQDADYLVHLAADVSGIKSLADPVLTVTTNVVGTYHFRAGSEVEFEEICLRVNWGSSGVGTISDVPC